MQSETFNHIHYMQLAIDEAKKAAKENEVPVGAVLLNNEGTLITAAYNQPIHLSDPSAHAEMLAIRKASSITKNYRLCQSTLYVTVEPCIMCMGAIIHARIERVVFGTWDTKWGAAGSLYNFSTHPLLNHHPEIIGGVLANECRALMQDFFRERRKAKA